jgi:short-subunit dehydrogenase
MKTPTPRCAVITGASQGLGKAFAEECAGRGMDLLLVALADTGLAELAKILTRSYGGRIETLELDLTDPGAAQHIRSTLRDRQLAPDLLINNAGVGFKNMFGESSAAQNECTIQLNVAALIRITQSLLPGLLQNADAWVLNVASLGAYYPMPSMPVYSSTKAFILNFSLLLREELRAANVRVSVLCPNGIRTNRGARALIEKQGWAGTLTCQYPDEVARAGLDGLQRNRAIIVPGAMNRMLRHLRPLVPRTLFMRLISRRWGTQQRSRTGTAKAALAAALHREHGLEARA